MSTTTDVLIAGAGPVGLMAALSLAREGIGVRIVDPAPSPSRHSKALVVQPAALETLRRVGVDAALVAAGLPVLAYNMYDARGRRLVRHEMQTLPTRFPFALHVSQRATERALAEALRGAGIEVERGIAVRTFAQDAEGVTVQLGDGTEARARYLVGCDGARSTVRRETGIDLVGTTYAERFVLADCGVESGLEQNEAHSFLAPDGILSLLPLPKGQRIILPIHGAAPELDEGTLRRWVAERCPEVIDLRVTAVDWLSDFRIHCRIAERYVAGRVFLCGDAAHIHSPAGGQGLNVGLQDAFELAWRLALVLRSNASPKLLDSYEPERFAVAARVLEQTDRLTKMFTTRKLLGRGARRAFFALAGRVPSLRRKIRHEMAGLSGRYAGEGALTAGSLRTDRLRVGERLPYVAGTDETWLSDTERRSLLLLLIAPDAERGARLGRLAGRLVAAYRKPPSVVLIAPSPVAAFRNGRVWIDAAGAVADATGLEEGAVLVRPDGRIAWVGQGNGLGGLAEFLDSFLVKRREPVPPPTEGLVCTNAGRA